MSVEVSTAIIAISLLVLVCLLVVFGIILTIALWKTLQLLNKTVHGVQTKIESVDSVFKAISNVGEVLQDKTNEFKREACDHTHQEYKKWKEEERVSQSINADDIMDVVEVGLRIWQKLKGRR